MITFFSIPKGFTGPMDTIQRRAVRTWQLAVPGCEIFLCGDDPGVAEAARDLGVQHIPMLEKNHHGTPFMDSAFRQVHERATQPVYCYINTDILLTTSFADAVRKVTLPSFMMVGERINIETADKIDFDAPDWNAQLQKLAADEGESLGPSGMDYFCFRPVPELINIAKFLIGRYVWDTWLLYNARRAGIPLIDATTSVLILHQAHDYAHMKTQTERPWLGEEADYNRNLGELKWEEYFGMHDSTHVLTPSGLHRAWRWRYLSNRIWRLAMWYPWVKPLFALWYRLPYYLAWPFTRMKRLFSKMKNGAAQNTADAGKSS